MSQILESPRDPSPMWLDLAHVVAGAPAMLGRASMRRSRHDEWPQPRGGWRLALVLTAQAGCAALTAGLLLLLGLGPV